MDLKSAMKAEVGTCVEIQKNARGYLPGDYPVARRVAGEIISLPMFPLHTTGQQIRVVEVIRDFVALGRRGRLLSEERLTALSAIRV